jgi:hypothetical protein
MASPSSPSASVIMPISKALTTQRCHRSPSRVSPARRRSRDLVGPFLAPPAVDTHPVAIAPADKAEAVVLDLVRPARPVRHGAGERRQAGLDEPGRWRKVREHWTGRIALDRGKGESGCGLNKGCYVLAESADATIASAPSSLIERAFHSSPGLGPADRREREVGPLSLETE